MRHWLCAQGCLASRKTNHGIRTSTGTNVSSIGPVDTCLGGRSLYAHTNTADHDERHDEHVIVDFLPQKAGGECHHKNEALTRASYPAVQSHTAVEFTPERLRVGGAINVDRGGENVHDERGECIARL